MIDQVEETPAKQSVYLSIPDEFLNVMDEPWMITLQDGPQEANCLEVLIYTVRRLPVKDAGEAERALEMLQILKAANEQEDAEYVELRQADFDWMKAQFKEHAHKLWAAPDSAYLRKWLDNNVQTKEPQAIFEEASPDGLAVSIPTGVA